VTPDRDAFAEFSRRLDAEDMRERVRRALDAAATGPMEDAADLSRALEAADPLGEGSERRWTVAIRDLVGAWPGRVAVATALGAVLVVGLIVGRVTTPIPGRAGLAQTPPLPAYRPQPDRGLALEEITAPASEQKFRQAMARYGEADFPQRAMPLLREAIAADPGNDQAQFWLGVVLLRDGRAADAIAPLEAAARLAPADRTYKGYLLYAYLQTGARHRAQALQQELLTPR